MVFSESKFSENKTFILNLRTYLPRPPPLLLVIHSVESVLKDAYAVFRAFVFVFFAHITSCSTLYISLM